MLLLLGSMAAELQSAWINFFALSYSASDWPRQPAQRSEAHRWPRLLKCRPAGSV